MLFLLQSLFHLYWGLDISSRHGGVCCKVSPRRLLHWNPVGQGVLLGRGPGLLSQQLQGLSQQTLAPAGGRFLLPAFQPPAGCLLFAL